MGKNHYKLYLNGLVLRCVPCHGLSLSVYSVSNTLRPPRSLPPTTTTVVANKTIHTVFDRAKQMFSLQTIYDMYATVAAAETICHTKCVAFMNCGRDNNS